jgi:hypothetical protein
MEEAKEFEKKELGKNAWDDLRVELENLDNEFVDANGVRLKPSQCFRITSNSFNVIYNTNCPDSLKEKVQSILQKYGDQDESYPREQEFFFP